jgi:ketosteroid isomerase-like protein
MFCHICGVEDTGDGRFCVRCGTGLVTPRQNSAGRDEATTPPIRVTEQSDSAGVVTIAADVGSRAGGSKPTDSPTPVHIAAPQRPARILIPWLGGLALGAIVVGIAVFMFRGEGAAARRDTAGGNEVNTATPNFNAGQTPTPRTNESAPSPQSSDTKVPRPTAENEPFDRAAIEREARLCLDGWVAATRAHDFETHMSFYASTLAFYYTRFNVSVQSVRTNRERAFTRYTKLDVQLTDVGVVPDPSGLTATAIFDKTWNFEGDKSSSGSVRQMVTLENINGQWLITGEKDLQVYYVNR